MGEDDDEEGDDTAVDKTSYTTSLFLRNLPFDVTRHDILVVLDVNVPWRQVISINLAIMETRMILNLKVERISLHPLVVQVVDYSSVGDVY